ncbi:MAG: hypothetical protein QF388_07275 [Acidimicrobiales bacterium]|nr:hypothetical protein [Acidimicrobiales bacterium]
MSFLASPWRWVEVSSGLFFIACQLLAIGGASKMLLPSLTSKTWNLLGFPSSLRFVRFVGALEFASAISAAVVGGIFFPFLIGGWYAIFFLMTFHLLRMPGAIPCGCFGTSNTPVSIRHLLMNGFFLIVSVIAVGTNDLPSELSSKNSGGILYLLLIVGGASLSYVLATTDAKSLRNSKDSQ